ncbi:MAG: hypothetical protein IJS97_00750 [Prevotella sp.]|nr:hypothetical protein [Prevotella sp.]
MKKAVYLLTLILSACGPSSSEDQVRTAAEKFAEAYFSCRYVEAAQFVTPASQKHLQFIASQVTAEDVEQLRSLARKPDFEVLSTEQLGDSTAEVVVEVHRFMQMDTIGRPCHLTENGRFTLMLRKQPDGQWLTELR